MGGRGGPGGAPGVANAESSQVRTAVQAVVDALAEAHQTSSYPYLAPGYRMVADVRDAMARDGITDRSDQDAAIRAASRAGAVDVSTAVAGYLLTDREIDQGIMLGGVMDHVISRRVA